MKSDVVNQQKNEKLLSPRSFSLLNKIANLHIALFYAYSFLHDTLTENSELLSYDGHLQDSARDCQTIAHKCFDYIFQHGESLVLLEHPLISMININIISKMEKNAQFHLIKLEQVGKKDKDQLLLNLLAEIHSISELGYSEHLKKQCRNLHQLNELKSNSASYDMEIGKEMGSIHTLKNNTRLCSALKNRYKDQILTSDSLTVNSDEMIGAEANDKGRRSKNLKPMIFKRYDRNNDNSLNYIEDFLRHKQPNIEIVQSDMPSELLKNVINLCKNTCSERQCCENVGTDLKLATEIKAQLDKMTELQEWTVVVGEKYGIVVSHEMGSFVHLIINSRTLIICKL